MALPEGQRESFVYDANGNLLRRDRKEVVNPGLIGVVGNLELRTLVARGLWIGVLPEAMGRALRPVLV